MRSEKNLEHLLSTVAARQDDSSAQPIVDEVRRRLVLGIHRRRRHRRRVIAVAAALVFAACVTLWFALSTDSALRFEVAGTSRSAGAWLSASESEELPVHFSNGASVLFSPGSRGRVADLRHSGATMEVGHGRVAVAVPHVPGADWTFLAGPFAVTVIGTRFDLAWDARTEVFELVLLDGSVDVRAPWLVVPHRVVAGQTLRLSAADGRDAGVKRAEPSPTNSAGAGASLDASREEEAIASTPDASHSGAASASAPNWRVLAASGNYRESLARAEAAGFDAEVSRSSSTDLLLLGDASRYGGNNARARQCYTTLRRSFAGTPAASLALFRLGVLDFPSPGAVASFEGFLQERPTDPLAPEALGRILEVYQRNGDTEQARAVARRYLKQYPKGGHAALARGVLGQ